MFGVDFFLDEAMKPWLLELNNFPSMEKASLDRWVNDPMIAETYNVVGFHYTGKPNAKHKQVFVGFIPMKMKILTNVFFKALTERYGIQNQLNFEPRLYARAKTEAQEEKEEYYNEEGLGREDYLDMVTEEELTPRDVRVLVQAEEELAQCRLYTRIFPDKDSNKFLHYMSPPSYADYLLDAWEARHGADRETGRSILKRKCLLNMHLQK